MIHNIQLHVHVMIHIKLYVMIHVVTKLSIHLRINGIIGKNFRYALLNLVNIAYRKFLPIIPFLKPLLVTATDTRPTSRKYYVGNVFPKDITV